MGGRRVVGHDGRTWRVRRRWLPWRLRLRRADWADSVDGTWVPGDLVDGLDSPLGFVVGVILALVFGALLVLLLPFALALLEALVLLVLLPAVVVLRVVFRTPWIIEASTDGPPAQRLTRSASGWRDSSELIDELSQELALGAR